MLKNRLSVALALIFVIVAGACGSGDTGGAIDTPESTPAAKKGDPAIVVGSFNFPESEILAEIYAQALEHEGYTVSKKLNLGSREVVFPSLEKGEINFLPEYIASSLSSGFKQTNPPADPVAARAKLEEAFKAKGVSVLDYAPGEDRDAFVVTKAYADSNKLTKISDLSKVSGSIAFSGPPECEARATCLKGLQGTYELKNLQFQSVAEGPARIAQLQSGDAQLILLFSTQPVIKKNNFVSLEDDRDLIAAENVVVVIRTDIVEAHGSELSDLINSISKKITTEELLDLNGKVELDAQDPADVAKDWLEEYKFLD